MVGDHSTPFLPAFGKVDKRKLGKVFSKKDKFILDTIYYPFRVKFNYTEENIEKFRKDLKTIRPMINEIFDFEKEIAINLNIDKKTLIANGLARFLDLFCLIDGTFLISIILILI